MKTHIATAAIILSALSTQVNAAWKERSAVDKLSDEKYSWIETDAIPGLNYKGQPVKATLVVHCLKTGLTQDDQTFLSAHVQFSHRILLLGGYERLRFDSGTVQVGKIQSNNEGSKMYLMGYYNDDNFVFALSKSSRLKIELQLDFLGKPIIEFNTKGAETALKKLPCGFEKPI